MKKPAKPNLREDSNQAAHRTLLAAIGEDEEEEQPPRDPRALNGQKGGLKGGAARAAKLTPEERSEIARKAAAARWKQE
jgi:hypothetical protein